MNKTPEISCTEKTHEFLQKDGYKTCWYCGKELPPYKCDKWLVQVFGEQCSESWEISVVKEDNYHGRRSWGWFDDEKLLVSHNGGFCSWPICRFVWDAQLKIAEELCRKLNAGEDVGLNNSSKKCEDVPVEKDTKTEQTNSNYPSETNPGWEYLFKKYGMEMEGL